MFILERDWPLLSGKLREGPLYVSLWTNIYIHLNISIILSHAHKFGIIHWSCCFSYLRRICGYWMRMMTSSEPSTWGWPASWLTSQLNLHSSYSNVVSFVKTEICPRRYRYMYECLDPLTSKQVLHRTCKFNCITCTYSVDVSCNSPSLLNVSHNVYYVIYMPCHQLNSTDPVEEWSCVHIRHRKLVT